MWLNRTHCRKWEPSHTLKNWFIKPKLDHSLTSQLSAELLFHVLFHVCAQSKACHTWVDEVTTQDTEAAWLSCTHENCLSHLFFQKRWVCKSTPTLLSSCFALYTLWSIRLASMCVRNTCETASGRIWGQVDISPDAQEHTAAVAVKIDTLFFSIDWLLHSPVIPAELFRVRQHVWSTSFPLLLHDNFLQIFTRIQAKANCCFFLCGFPRAKIRVTTYVLFSFLWLPLLDAKHFAFFLDQ